MAPAKALRSSCCDRGLCIFCAPLWGAWNASHGSQLRPWREEQQSARVQCVSTDWDHSMTALRDLCKCSAARLTV